MNTLKWLKKLRPSDDRNLIIAMYIAIVLLWACWALIVLISYRTSVAHATEGISSISVLGQAGDAFGVLNSIVSLLLMVAAFVTLVEQRENAEKIEQQHEDNTREGHFFQLLSLMNDAYQNCQVTGQGYEEQGRQVQGHRAVYWAVKARSADNPEIFANAVDGCDRWFKSVEVLLDFVLQSEEDQRVFFKRVVRSQLSDLQEKLLRLVAALPQYASLRVRLVDAGIVVEKKAEA